MGSIREFRFITGIETSANPAAADPVLDDDFMTKGFADGHYGGGGGGGSLRWNVVAGKAPIFEEDEFGEEVFRFETDADQHLTGTVKVPSGYTGGIQIFVKVALYSPSTSNNIKMKSVASLIKEGVDAINSTTNQHTSTTAEITLTAPANEYREVDLDITDVNGQINGQDVASGDIIRVDLYRDSAGESTSDTAETRMVPSGTEGKFTV